MRAPTLVAIIVAFLAVLLALIAPDPLLLLACGAVLIAGFYLLWPARGIPILILPFLMQMLSISVKPVSTGITGQPLSQLAEFSFDLRPAVYLSLVSIFMLAAGMRVGTGMNTLPGLAQVRQEVMALPQRFVLTLSLSAYAAGKVAETLSPVIAPLRQPLLNLAQVTYIGIFMLLLWSLVTRRQLPLAIGLASFEFLIGISGFFSEFRYVIFIAAFAIICSQVTVKKRTVLLGVFLLAFAVYAASFWTWVKPEYRSYLNDGTGQQVAVQAYEDRAAFLNEAFGRFDSEAFEEGLDRGLARLSYIDFLAGTIEHTNSIGTEDQEMRSMVVLRHILVPRAVWPEKPPLESDTLVTERYTGLVFGNAELTSVSIGYLGELFIDFRWFAPLATFLIGLLVGFQMRVLMAFKGTPLFVNLSLAVLMTLPVMLFERALAKMVAPMIMTFIIALVLQRMVLPRMLPMMGLRGPRQVMRPRTA